MTTWVPVRSTVLRAVSYDPGPRRLDVEFQGGARYRYDGVSLATYAALMRAESLGAYFNGEIRDRHPYTEL